MVILILYDNVAFQGHILSDANLFLRQNVINNELKSEHIKAEQLLSWNKTPQEYHTYNQRDDHLIKERTVWPLSTVIENRNSIYLYSDILNSKVLFKVF